MIVKGAPGGRDGSCWISPELRKCGSKMVAAPVLVVVVLFGQCYGHYAFKEYSYVSLPKYVNHMKDVVDVARR